MDPTAIIKNFNGLLVAAVPFLERAGIALGDDEWDDFTERVFDLTVLTPLREEGVELDWQYGIWPRGEQPTSQLAVRVAASPQSWLCGEPGDGGTTNVQYRDGGSETEVPRFVFREFQHPFEKDMQGNLGFVLGEVVEENAGMKAGTRICVPVEVCSFEIG